MRSSRNILLIVLLLVCGLSAAAQTAPKIFDRNGSHFIYPDGWSFEDASNNNSEELTFGRPDMDVQLKVSLFKTPLTTPEKLAEIIRDESAMWAQVIREANIRPE